MTGLTVVLGFGAVGRPVARMLCERGDVVRVAQRSRPADLPEGAQFTSCDVLDVASLRRAVAGASQVVLALGFAYDAKVWAHAWPLAMRNVVEVCADAGARVVFIDNLYMAGPQHEPLREDMPLTEVGSKPKVRSEITRIWMAARDRVRFAALRAPDFYGPGVTLSHLGESAFGAMGKGKPATLIAPPDTPHDFAYVPDIARAAAMLLDAPDDAYGQAWNVPCAPTRTPRQILQIGADALGAQLRLRSLPLSLLPVFGLVSPFMREVADLSFTWDRPYRVDATKFTERFGLAPTPFEVGARETARSFRSLAAVAQTSRRTPPPVSVGR